MVLTEITCNDDKTVFNGCCYQRTVEVLGSIMRLNVFVPGICSDSTLKFTCRDL